MKAVVKIVLAVNLAIVAVLAFVYPHLMVGPGKLIPGHRELETDCFACHAPLRGATSERCTTCHKPEDIGRVSTKAQPLAKPLTSVPFHQKLTSQDCVACHSDHAGTKRQRAQGRFQHSLLQPALREQCHTCHKTPADSLHRQISGNCGQCHSQNKWTPANFDHDKFFVLDRDHSAACVTCHLRNDYTRYTCYGCHEHTPANIRREHIEEGIRHFDNCVECHRSADEHDIKGRERDGKERRGESDKHRKKHDD
jgi:hypothetical protein